MNDQPEGYDLHLVVATLVRYYAQKHDGDFWAWMTASDIVSGSDPERAFSLVQALVRAAPDDQLETIGAGEVEVLVTTHVAALIDSLESEARRDPRFCEALASIWLIADNIPPDALRRLQAVTGNRILVATQAELDASRSSDSEQFERDS